MKISIKKYLLYSSVFAIFTEAFFFNFIIDWKLLYLIIIINYFLLIKIKKITLNLYFAALILFFFIHGILTYTIISIPYNFMLSQIIGITIIGTYYYNFIPLYKKEEIINVYLKIALIVAIIGYPLYFLNINLNDGRLQSIFKEPAHYVIVVIPACYYYLNVKNYVNFAIIFGTLILSNSSLGYIGCGLMFIIPNLTLRRIGALLGLIPIVIAVFFFVYNEFPFFKLRVDDTYNSLNVINTGKFDEDTNLSSYVLISNLYIAKKNITDHPFGSGIGSHHYMHTNRYLKEMRPPKYLRKQKKETDNSFDANSLFTRICSEFGILGFILLLYAIYKSSKCFKSNELFFAQGIFIYFLLKLFRDGTYFPPEFFLFIWLFYFSYKENINAKVQ
ncbi:O-antigen ligase family protein [Flavobacterium maritimum]|uniref:O-antigen ligase family protein n=1 Tax=Flavobacterium maritimum TaxID=3149042 RepID=UPI0032B35CA8